MRKQISAISEATESVIKKIRSAKYKDEVEEILKEQPQGFVIYVESSYGYISKKVKTDAPNKYRAEFEDCDIEGTHGKTCSVHYAIFNALKKGLYVDVKSPKGMSDTAWVMSTK